jgi:DNA mismatch endonuclease (patch repair protein)
MGVVLFGLRDAIREILPQVRVGGFHFQESARFQQQPIWSHLNRKVDSACAEQPPSLRSDSASFIFLGWNQIAGSAKVAKLNTGRQLIDTRSPEQRRRIMQSIKSKDTGPELIVRRLLLSLGYRYRLHKRSLAGKPDIVFSPRRKAIFIHGCFWHGHECKKGNPPKSRLDYWEPEINANKARDQKIKGELESDGWTLLVIWQCETSDSKLLEERLNLFLGGSRKNRST